MVARKRGWITVVEKTDKRSGKTIRYEAEVFVNTKTGKVSHKITEFKDGKKIKSTELKDAKSFRDAVNKRVKSGAVVPDSFQREYESKTENVQENREEIAKLERVVDPKKDKPKTYTQKRERITYENSKGETVTVDVLTNIGNRPSGTEYAVLKYSNGRTETFSSKQTFDGRMATIAQRQNVKIKTLSESKKERDPEVDRGVILPSSIRDSNEYHLRKKKASEQH